MCRRHYAILLGVFQPFLPKPFADLYLRLKRRGFLAQRVGKPNPYGFNRVNVLRKSATPPMWVCSGFGNPLRPVIFSPYPTHFAWLRLWGCGNSRCSILLHRQICVNPRNFDNLNGLSQQGAGKRPHPPTLMVR